MSYLCSVSETFKPLIANEAEHDVAAEKRCQTQFPLLWFLVEYKNPAHKAYECCWDSHLALQHIPLTVHYRQEKAGLTYGKAHAKGNISYCVHAAVDWYMTQIYEVAHNWHHGGVHHSWLGGKEKHFRKILPFFFSPAFKCLGRLCATKGCKDN